MTRQLERVGFKFGLILLLLIRLFPAGTALAEPASACPSQGYAVAYSNGIWTDYDGAKTDLHALSLLIGSTYNGEAVSYHLLYNETDGKYSLGDLAETFEQRAQELDATGALNNHWEIFWETLWGTNVEGSVLTKWFPGLASILSTLQSVISSQAITDIAASISNPSTNIDYTINDVLLDSFVASGQKILIVGHSQGALFANQYFNYISPRASANSVAVVDVAPASTYVAPGPSAVQGGYVLSDADVVINGLRSRGVNGVLSNTVVGVPLEPNFDALGHSFTAIYLNGTIYANGDSESLRSHVNDAVTKTLSSLVTPSYSMTFDYIGNPYDSIYSIIPNSTMISGHTVASVTFKGISCGYTGTADITNIASYSIGDSSNSTPTLDSSGGVTGDFLVNSTYIDTAGTKFTFKDGNIVDGQLYVIGYSQQDTIFTQADPNGRSTVFDRIIYSASPGTAISGESTLSPGVWVAANQ